MALSKCQQKLRVQEDQTSGVRSSKVARPHPHTTITSNRFRGLALRHPINNQSGRGSFVLLWETARVNNLRAIAMQPAPESGRAGR